MTWKRRALIDIEAELAGLKVKANAAAAAANIPPEARTMVVVRLRPDGSHWRSRATTRQAAIYTLRTMPALFKELERLETKIDNRLLEVHDDEGNRVAWLEPATDADKATP